MTTKKPELLTAKGLPKSIEFDLDAAPEEVGPYIDTEHHHSTRNIGSVGYVYNDRVNHWFTVALERDVYVIRAPRGHRCRARTNKNPLKVEGDACKGFTSEAPIHIVNENSVRELSKVALERNNGQRP